MGILLAERKMDKTSMFNDETTEITLTISAYNDFLDEPADIVLLINNSSTMNTEDSESISRINALKTAAKQFTQDIANKSNNITSGNAASINKSTIGVIAFNSRPITKLKLSNSVSEINNAIDDIVSEGGTSYNVAFTRANNVLKEGSNKRRFIIFVTDGKVDTDLPPERDDYNAYVTTGRAIMYEDIFIYAIGIGNDIEESTLQGFTKVDDRVRMTSNANEIQDAFNSFANIISNTAPTNISIVNTVGDEFIIIGTPIENKPTDINSKVQIINDNKSIAWDLETLGYKEPQTATLTFTVKYIGDTAGVFNVNAYMGYNDYENNDVDFISNSDDISIALRIKVDPNDDFGCVNIDVPCCNEFINIDLPNESKQYNIQGGSLLNINIAFNDVCPNKQMLIAVIVCGLENNGNGFSINRIITVNTPTKSVSNDDTTCNTSNLIVPIEVLLPDISDNNRNINIRVIANYLNNSTVNCNCS